MKPIVVALMFITFSAFAQEAPKPQESYVCIPEGVVRAAVALIADQTKRIADLERQLAERK